MRRRRDESQPSSPLSGSCMSLAALTFCSANVGILFGSSPVQDVGLSQRICLNSASRNMGSRYHRVANTSTQCGMPFSLQTIVNRKMDLELTSSAAARSPSLRYMEAMLK